MLFLNAQNVRIIIIHRIKEIFDELKNELSKILRESALPTVGVQRTRITINQVSENIQIQIENDITMDNIRIPVQRIKNFSQKIEAGEIAQKERNSDQHRHVSSFIYKNNANYNWP